MHEYNVYPYLRVGKSTNTSLRTPIYTCAWIVPYAQKLLRIRSTFLFALKMYFYDNYNVCNALCNTVTAKYSTWKKSSGDRFYHKIH